MSTIRPIRNDADLDAALARIDTLLTAAPGTPEFDECELLSILVEEYEKRHHPVPPPTPIQAIEFALEQRGLTRRDLEPLIGSSGRVSEVLSGKRGLTLPMIRRLHFVLQVPAEVLIQDPDDRLSA